jgi:hypothetical protein
MAAREERLTVTGPLVWLAVGAACVAFWAGVVLGLRDLLLWVRG